MVQTDIQEHQNKTIKDIKKTAIIAFKMQLKTIVYAILTSEEQSIYSN